MGGGGVHVRVKLFLSLIGAVLASFAEPGGS